MIEFILKQIRENENLSQKKIAPMVGLDRTSISNYENGKLTTIPIKFLQWIFDKGYDLNCLFSDEKEIKYRKEVPEEKLPMVAEPKAKYYTQNDLEVNNLKAQIKILQETIYNLKQIALS